MWEPDRRSDVPVSYGRCSHETYKYYGKYSVQFIYTFDNFAYKAIYHKACPSFSENCFELFLRKSRDLMFFLPDVSIYMI